MNIPRKEHKIVIIGDSHSRGCAWNLKPHLRDKFEVSGLVKPGSCTNILVEAAKNDIMNLTKSDAIIFCGGSNDLGMNNAKMALRHITDFMKMNNHTIKCPSPS
jgi:hypothetical protein